MQAEIISVGTELLLGHTVNTDATHVARMLAEQGLDLVRVQTVGDNAGRLEETVRAALERASVVIATGGLGPTDDDLTRETVARLAGLPLEEDSGSLARLHEYFGDRPLPANERRQALLPRGARPFPNAVGTAPGCAVPVGRDQWILLLPGPPGELLPMLEASVRPFLRELCGGVIASFMARVFGMGEGAVAVRLGSLTAGSNPTVATYAGDGEMFVRVTAKAADHAAARALAEPVLAEVLRLLGHVVYGVDVPSLEAVVVAELARQGKSLATAESCTGGLIARRITDQPGASGVFGCGLVTYANEAKTRLAGVPGDMLRAHGAVSPQVALAMARGVRESAGADLGLGVTGIAGPGGGTPQKPVGLVYIALADAQGAWLRELRPQGQYPGRDMVRRLSASHALDMVRRRLSGLPVERWEEPGAASCLPGGQRL